MISVSFIFAATPVIWALLLRVAARKALSWVLVYSACWPDRIGDATAVDALTGTDQVLFGGETGGGLLVGQPVGNIAHVGIGQCRGKTLHDGVVALARLELLQLLDQILGVLARNLGVDRRGRIAVGGVTRHTDLAVERGALGKIGLGSLGMSAERQDGRSGGAKK